MNSCFKGWGRLRGYGLAALIFNILAWGPQPSMAATQTKILALGDSLTAGFGLAPNESFPARLEAALRARGHDVRVLNAGVSGDTSAGGRARLDWALGDKPQYVIVELGANDALRGLDPDQLYANLDAILKTLQDRQVKTLLAGMLAPRNMGPDYAARFDAVYSRLQEKYRVPLYPFFLQGVAMNRDLTLPDGLHPNAQGVDRIVANILPMVETLIATPAGASQ
jgi:acyl-CoA thioesterase-1